MAIERKFLRVSRFDEEMVINEYSWFGWNLVSSQDVHENDVNIQYDFVLEPWLVTSTTDYVKLILERDTSNPNYKRLVQLENDYYANMNVYTDCYDVRFGGPCTLLVAVLLLFILGAIDTGNILYTSVLAVFLFLVVFFRRRKMKKERLIANYALDKAIKAKEEASQLF